MTPTIEDLLRIKDVTPAVAALILAVIHGDVDPTEPMYWPVFPETRAWVRRCYHTPKTYEVIEHAVGELLGCDFEALEVEAAPTDSFGGNYIGSLVCGYANMGDPYVATLVHCYRDLGAGDPFEEDGWYVCGWADLLEAAEAHYREDGSSEEDD